MGFPSTCTRQQSKKSRGVKDQEHTREQKKVSYREQDFSITRSASPVPSLAMQIPHQQHPATASTMTILKRNTAPYPSPNTSPNISPPTPGRSYTHPVGKDLEKHQQRYMNRMHSKLVPHLKTLGQTQGIPKESQKEAGPEDEPVPTFFISPGASNYLDENDMLDEEFITIGDLNALEFIMEEYKLQTAEYMPDPEEPIYEPSQKLVVTVDSPSEHREVLSHPQSATALGLLAAPAIQGPVSDSGVGSTMGSPGTLASNSANAELQGFATTGCSGANALSGHARKIPATPSLDTEAGLGNGSLMGRPSLVSEAGSSYTVASFQELTPPSSATLSPTSFHATTHELSKTMDLQSIHAIERHVISPMSDNAEFVGLKGVLSSAKEKMYQGQIRCLRDVEKYFTNMVNKMSSSVSPEKFFDALLNGIQNAYPDVLEKDRVRETDIPYTPGYFLDVRHQLGIVPATYYSNAQQRISKRKLPIDAEAPLAKRPVITTTDFNEEPFFKPIPKLRQNNPSKQLEILTHLPSTVYTSCQLVGHPQSHIGNNSTFQFDETTKNTIAESQSCDARTYYQPTISQTWQTNDQLVMPTAIINGHGGYSPETLQAPMNAPAPLLVSFTVSPIEPASAVSAGSPVHSSPISRANSKEPPNYSCEFCQKTFPRPCDLTKHRKTHDRPFKCDIKTCKYHTEGFPTNKEKERHQNDIHALNSKEWKCEFTPCTYKSKRESNCKQHMEKAHAYVYKRMKRNPRRRDQGVAVTPPRRKKNTSIANESQSSTPVMTNENFEIPHISQSNDYLLSLLDPNQLQGNDFTWGSPITNTDYDQSPLSIVRNDFDDHRGTRTNPMMTGSGGDWIMFEGVDNPADQYPGISDFQQNFPHEFNIGNESAWNLDTDTPD